MLVLVLCGGSGQVELPPVADGADYGGVPGEEGAGC